ncbi:MurR/RpiR family transcriptional regulator [Faecalibaculum rodentium]|jgi:DNA-binding MurR/RpiR family transcriptional regulator|uniref:MurR/RpiR family transcriptional regulator n=1 Tax=Faecalibaculum rodentium TaxID=1702221 RepID=UPI00256F4C74|nr:MurR/RpiR family transcriptional regulator [Faecalibaculum rodentium]
MFLFQRVEELGVGSNSAMSDIADYILEDRQRILEKSLQEVAQETFTSKASVVRFAKGLGYSGWKAFLKEYLKELNYQQRFEAEVDFSYPFTDRDTPAQISRNLRTLMVQTLDEMLENLDEAALTRFVNLMQRANRIVVFCVSPHTYSAQLFQRKMMTIQKPVQVVQAREMGLTARSMTPQDLAIIISYSGMNVEAEPMTVVNYLKSHQVPVAAITSAGTNDLRREIDTVLTLTTREALYNKIATFSTEHSLQYLLNLLFSCYFARQYEKNWVNKVESARELEKHRGRPAAIHE